MNLSKFPSEHVILQGNKLKSIYNVQKVCILLIFFSFLPAVANAKTVHIHELVKGQKNCDTASVKNYNRIVQENNRRDLAQRMQNNRNNYQSSQFSAPSNSKMSQNRRDKPLASQVLLSLLFESTISPKPLSTFYYTYRLHRVLDTNSVNAVITFFIHTCSSVE